MSVDWKTIRSQVLVMGATQGQENAHSAGKEGQCHRRPGEGTLCHAKQDQGSKRNTQPVRQGRCTNCKEKSNTARKRHNLPARQDRRARGQGEAQAARRARRARSRHTRPGRGARDQEKTNITMQNEMRT